MSPLRPVFTFLLLFGFCATLSAMDAEGCNAEASAYAQIEASEADIVVAPWGNDDNDGTVEAPVASLRRASFLSSAGSIVLIRGGVYNQRQVIERGGSTSQPVVYAAWPGEQPVIDGTDVELKPSQGLLQVNASDVVVDGIEIRNSVSRGFQVYDSDRVTLRRAHIHHIASKGYSGSGDDLVVEGNVFDNLVMQNHRGDGPRPWPAGIASWHRPDGSRLSGMIIRDNVISKVWGECVGLVFVDNAQVHSNQITDCYSVGLYLDNTRAVQVQRNVIRSTGADFNRIDNGRAMVGINLAVEHYDSGQASAASDIVIANNLLVSMDRGVGFFNDPNNTNENNHYRNVSIVHNVICDTEHAAVHFHADQRRPEAADADGDNLLANNVLCEAASGVQASLQLAEPSRWLVDFNAWSGRAPAGAGSNHVSLQAQPMDLSLTALSAWKTDAASPLRGAGMATADTSVDAFCTPRNAERPAIGLFEHSPDDP